MENSRTRLTLVTPRRFEPAEFARRLGETLAAADVAAVILGLEPSETDNLRQVASELLPVTQKAGAALLLRDRADLVRELGADGAHVSRRETIDDTKRMLKPDFIVGAGDCTTRHAAMLVGEAMPDYVFLGRLDEEEDRSASESLVEWWAELFELPCVALASEDLSEVARLAAVGADFVALRDVVWTAPDGPAAALDRATGALRSQGEAVA